MGNEILQEVKKRPSLATGSARAPLIERGDDFYKTPPAAVHALLDNFPVPQIIHESSCGDGAIVDILRATGRKIYASDLVDRGCQDSFVADFLEQKEPIPGVECCLGNPPFKDAPAFVRKSRELYPMTIMLLRLAFLESVSRTDILDSGDLFQVLLFKNRLEFMHRVGWQGKRNSNSAMPFAFFIWKRDYQGSPLLKRITWKKKNLKPTPLEAYIASH